MTSSRKRKKVAAAQGLSERELALTELLEEVLDSVRWLQILGYSNQYLMNQKLKVTQAERDKVLEAAARAVDKDRKMHEWTDRLAQLKGDVLGIKRSMNRAKKDMAQGKPAPPGLLKAEEGADGQES